MSNTPNQKAKKTVFCVVLGILLTSQLFCSPAIALPPYQIIQVTDNSYDDYYPQISGNNVVWQGSDGIDDEIFFWDGSSMTQVTYNSYDDYYPQISGNNVVWYGSEGIDDEIFFWDGSSITQVTDNNTSDGSHRISGSYFVCCGLPQPAGPKQISTNTNPIPNSFINLIICLRLTILCVVYKSLLQQNLSDISFVCSFCLITSKRSFFDDSDAS